MRPWRDHVPAGCAAIEAIAVKMDRQQMPLYLVIGPKVLATETAVTTDKFIAQHRLARTRTAST